MAKRGRKPLDLNVLIWFEGRWGRIFSAMRDGIEGGQEMHSPPYPPPDSEYPTAPPPEIKHPGAIHDWQKDARTEWRSRWRCDVHYSAGVPPERRLWEALKRVQTATEVCSIFSVSKILGPWGMLDEHAEQFVAALRDSRYPRKASTKDDRRLLYCAQVMAGISLYIRPATAVDRLRKLKHQHCGCSHCNLIASLNIKASTREKVTKL